MGCWTFVFSLLKGSTASFSMSLYVQYEHPITESCISNSLVYKIVYAIEMEGLVSVDLGENWGEKQKFQIVRNLNSHRRTPMPQTFSPCHSISRDFLQLLETHGS